MQRRRWRRPGYTLQLLTRRRSPSLALQVMKYMLSYCSPTPAFSLITQKLFWESVCKSSFLFLFWRSKYNLIVVGESIWNTLPSHWPCSRGQGRKITIAFHHPDIPMVFQWLGWAGQRSGSVYLTPGCWRVCLALGQMDPLSFLLWQPQSKYRGRKTGGLIALKYKFIRQVGRFIIESYCMAESRQTPVHTFTDQCLAHIYMWCTEELYTRWKRPKTSPKVWLVGLLSYNHTHLKG